MGVPPSGAGFAVSVALTGRLANWCGFGRSPAPRSAAAPDNGEHFH